VFTIFFIAEHFVKVKLKKNLLLNAAKILNKITTTVSSVA